MVAAAAAAAAVIVFCYLSPRVLFFGRCVKLLYLLWDPETEKSPKPRGEVRGHFTNEVGVTGRDGIRVPLLGVTVPEPQSG